MREPRVLVVDVGGHNVKLWRSDTREKRRSRSSPDLSAESMVREVLELAADFDYDVVALGLPCRVIAGRPVDEPPNLGRGWVDFDYASAFGKPVRMVNDAVLQAIGAYTGGRMLFLGLGTHVGSALVHDGLVLSLELGQILHDGEEIAHRLGRESLERLGRERWSELVLEVAPALRGAFHADYLVLGGGNASKLGPLPPRVLRGSNEDCVPGGVRLWTEYPDPAEPLPAIRRVI